MSTNPNDPREMSSAQPAPTEIALPQAPPSSPPSDISTPSRGPAPENIQTPTIDTSHHNFLGRMVRGIFTGENTSYDYDDTGKMVETRTPQKPGQLFRSILAGALLGGAMGAQDTTHTFAGGFTAGAAGVMKDRERQEQLKRQQAGTEYQERLKGREADRQDVQLGMEKEKMGILKREQQNKDDLAKANTLLLNAQTVDTLHQAAGRSLKYHVEMKDSDAVDVSTYHAMGLKADIPDVPESEMTKLLEARPDAAGLVWKVTGMKYGRDANGYPTYDAVVSGFNLKGRVPLTKALLDKWRPLLKDTHPEVFEHIKAGDNISVEDYKSYSGMYALAFNQKTLEDKESGEKEYKAAQADEARARASSLRISAAKETKDQAKVKALEAANKHLNEVGGDYSQMNPDERRLLSEQDATILEYTSKAYDALVRERANQGIVKPDPMLESLGRDVEALIHQTTESRLSVPDPNKYPTPPARLTPITPEAWAVFLKMNNGNEVKARLAAQLKGWGGPASAAAPSAPAPSEDRVFRSPREIKKDIEAVTKPLDNPSLTSALSRGKY